MIKWFEGLHAVNLQQSRVTGSSTSSLCNASWDGEAELAVQAVTSGSADDEFHRLEAQGWNRR